MLDLHNHTGHCIAGGDFMGEIVGFNRFDHVEGSLATRSSQVVFPINFLEALKYGLSFGNVFRPFKKSDDFPQEVS